MHLGHEDLSFTRRVYVHLDASDGPDPELLDDVTGCDMPSPMPNAEADPTARGSELEGGNTGQPDATMPAEPTGG